MEKQTEKFLNKVFILGGVLVVGVLVFLAGQLILQHQTQEQQYAQQISISGEGQVYITPDIATLSLGVKKDGTDIASIVQDTTGKMNGIIDAIKKLGIKDEDIQTTQYSLNPQYQYNPKTGERIPQGYEINQQISVKIRDFTKIGDALNIGQQNGATLVGDLSFTVDNPEKAKADARAKAIAQAEEKAEGISKAAHIRLGKIVNISEGYTPMGFGMGGINSKMLDSSIAPAAPIIQPGQQQVTVDITLVYEVE